MAARRRRDNIVVAVLAVLAVLGGGHAVLSWFDEPPHGPSDADTITVIGHAQLASSFAEDFVVSYLGATAGQQDRISEYVEADQQMRLPSTAHPVTDPVTVHLSRAESSASVDVWTVTVSVHEGRSGTTAGTRRYYQVAVSVTPDGRRRALTLPAAVDPPGRGPDISLAYATPCSAETPLADVASGFLKAYLTGSGDVARYIAAGAGITSLQPAPFTDLDSVSVTSADSSCGSSSEAAQVLATVSPKGKSGASASLSYPLSMVRSSGQWQVQGIDRVPALTSPLTVVTETGPAGAGGPVPTSSSPAVPTTTVQIPPATQN
ncbi:conjugal transfer protein [Nocardia vermiculata]|uniref:Conjugal transfer protein n=2 Tax=Nocardia vermiculata TaxID=257274 RepID=A0A846Y585_9NOCA|nr:conjugal transfer protein [Nocardia vermiculata]